MTMDDGDLSEIELASDGDGISLIGERGPVEESIAANGLRSRQLDLSKLKTAFGASAAVAKAGAAIEANSSRWMKSCWNLLSNPVDFEQREGRVHRFMGHAERKNGPTRIGRTCCSRRRGHGTPRSLPRSRLPSPND